MGRSVMPETGAGAVERVGREPEGGGAQVLPGGQPTEVGDGAYLLAVGEEGAGEQHGHLKI